MKKRQTTPFISTVGAIPCGRPFAMMVAPFAATFAIFATTFAIFATTWQTIYIHVCRGTVGVPHFATSSAPFTTTSAIFATIAANGVNDVAKWGGYYRKQGKRRGEWGTPTVPLHGAPLIRFTHDTVAPICRKKRQKSPQTWGKTTWRMGQPRGLPLRCEYYGKIPTKWQIPLTKPQNVSIFALDGKPDPKYGTAHVSVPASAHCTDKACLVCTVCNAIFGAEFAILKHNIENF